MATRPYPILTVNEKAARAIRAGHPWVYGVETTGPDRPCENGDLVDVVSQKGRWLGTGLLNDHSKIRVRLLSRNTPTTGLMRPFGGGGSNTPWTTGRPSWGTTFPAPG